MRKQLPECMYVCTGILDAERIVMRFTWIYKESAAADKEEIEWSDISESDVRKCNPISITALATHCAYRSILIRRLRTELFFAS